MPTDRLTRDEWLATGRLLLQPLDLEILIKKGILAKKGAWYRVIKNFKTLPAHVRAQVCEIKWDKHGKNSMIKFAKMSKRSKAKLEKVVGTLPKS